MMINRLACVAWFSAHGAEKMKKLGFVAMLLLLGGCQFWIAGRTVDNSMVLIGEGTADPMAGTTRYTFTIEGTGVKCTGRSAPKPGTNNRAIHTIKCDDGRTAKGESWLISMDTGEGEGTDSCGNKVITAFSVNKSYVDEKLAEFRAKVKASPNAGNDKCASSMEIPPHNDPLV